MSRSAMIPYSSVRTRSVIPIDDCHRGACNLCSRTIHNTKTETPLPSVQFVGPFDSVIILKDPTVDAIAPVMRPVVPDRLPGLTSIHHKATTGDICHDIHTFVA